MGPGVFTASRCGCSASATVRHGGRKRRACGSKVGVLATACGTGTKHLGSLRERPGASGGRYAPAFCVGASSARRRRKRTVYFKSSRDRTSAKGKRCASAFGMREARPVAATGMHNENSRDRNSPKGEHFAAI